MATRLRRSPKQLSWHSLREPDDLDAEAAAQVARIPQDNEAAKVVDLSRRLCRIVRGRSGSERTTCAPATWRVATTWMGAAT